MLRDLLLQMKKIKIKKNITANSARWLERHINDEFVIKSKSKVTDLGHHIN